MDTPQNTPINDAINTHRQNYHQVLAIGSPVNISTFIPTYRAMAPLLHHHLNDNWIDVSTLSYAITRLPSEYCQAQHVIMVGDQKQLPQVMSSSRIWQKVSAKNRRRQSFYNPISQTLVFIITSDSDIDDIINAGIAISIETSKIHSALRQQRKQYDDHELQSLFGINENELSLLKKTMGLDWKMSLASWGVRGDISVQLLKNDQAYFYGFEDWVDQIHRESLYLDLFETPVYFVSSNTHSLTNLISGYVWQIEAKLFTFIEEKYPQIYQQWQQIKSNSDPTRVYDFVYYLSKVYLEEHPNDVLERNRIEVEKGIRRLVSTGPFDTVTQIIPVNSIPHFDYPDPQLTNLPVDQLRRSQAVIINIEYPLGQAAIFLLKTFFKYFKNIKGIYIIGKAAILNGEIGDIQIPNVVLDEKTSSTYTFDNCFNHFPVSITGVHTHESQKALSLYGTFLENKLQMENYLSAGYNVIEMESGPYLAAIYQHLNPTSSPKQGSYQIQSPPFDLGIINYASDNPLVETLLTAPLITRGIEPTYAATTAVIRRIIELESKP